MRFIPVKYNYKLNLCIGNNNNGEQGRKCVKSKLDTHFKLVAVLLN